MSVESAEANSVFLSDDATTERLGRLVQDAVTPSSSRWVVFLRGDLGAGKTTLVRGLMRGFGYDGAVKSPTFTLVEPYESDEYHVYHFDLYRLVDPEELEFVGLEDYLDAELPSTLILIEWPERGGSALPGADIEIDLEVTGTARRARLTGRSVKGLEAVASILSQRTVLGD
ncbi:MAG: tRNA (adenosine(37)-N6)-threonylcarbamoyltransferase complex ATPase subunit type 1 TsaE [Gammaproteobacteria bacterium]|uniref:tRNA threonylcarbamoyladenosine biosynthesis protein TsaE n=1 Tax=OM182 bacterium MED-G24 TaxID=1986255 RepID=A0A2A5X0Q3_9GAMM|nr:tRNA (adenosine(37)-N6)-threonylcarbamoyltransferase complex ATPase subunit type 1 TsaE [Gammaproteobacteria bacterium]PDH42261.1 MAG: tRNA (adenosine(37)-N6)-threonylcarbamoyltransferase complex ATPase subunit type 1 TsaE [OM182 bacterium MED-G24]RPG23149.1 MAG: tRNA (adenosine(37)-N6)-threonylcarbamoyltransferase complex ATPase subunit type 1 TsaE [Gammaproteobacteria bacterium TMED50]